MANKPNYWQKRNLKRAVDAEIRGEKGLVKVLALYDQSQKNIERDIKSIYDNYSENGILDLNELKQSIGKEGAKDFLRKLSQKAEKMGLDPNQVYDERYLYRLTRLEAIQEQVKLEAMSSTNDELDLHTSTYRDVLKNGYSATQSDLSRQGINPSFTTLNTDVTNQILRSVWANSNYSNRVWGNKMNLAVELNTLVGAGLTSGQSYEKTARQIRDRYDVSRFEAVRLVRTENAYYYSQSEAQSYIDDGIEQYTLDVTLDGRTSSICQSIDEGEVFETANISIGLNYPPLHPNCRTVPRVVFEGEKLKPVKDREERIERFANFDDGSYKSRWDKAMQKQMNPKKNGQVHDYNAEMNQATQDYSRKLIDKNVLRERLGEIVSRIPDTDPLKPALEGVATRYGWKKGAEALRSPTVGQESENSKSVRTKFKDLEWDFNSAKLTQAQVDFIEGSGLKFDKNSAEVSLLNAGQYNADRNSLSLASDRTKISQRILAEPKLYENVFKHELGHAIDYYAPFLDQKVGDFFSSGNEFTKAISRKAGEEGYTIDESSKEAISIFQHRVAQGLSNKKAKEVVYNLDADDFREQLGNTQSFKVGERFVNVPFDTMIYMTDPKELFAESYALYHTDPKYLQDRAPNIYKYVDRITKLKL